MLFEVKSFQYKQWNNYINISNDKAHINSLPSWRGRHSRNNKTPMIISNKLHMRLCEQWNLYLRIWRFILKEIYWKENIKSIVGLWRSKIIWIADSLEKARAECIVCEVKKIAGLKLRKHLAASLTPVYDEVQNATAIWCPPYNTPFWLFLSIFIIAG